MNNKWVIIGVVVAVLIIGGITIFSQNKSNQVASDRTETETMEKTDGEAMMDGENKDGSMMDKGTEAENSIDKEGSAMIKKGAYKDYSADTVKTEQSAGQKVVLFFHAPWCPYCRAADSAFKAKLDQIPSGVTVLKTDYDSNTELKKKYGVTYQHTFVQIDQQGNMVTKWNGGDIDTLVKNIK